MPVHPRSFAIPARLNAMLVLVVSATLCAALVWFTTARGVWLVAAMALFALAFQTNFALFHEAAHRKLHGDPVWNAALGTVCGISFGMSFSMFAVTHTAHHLRNRTDEELFDLYYAGQSRVKKAVVWYGMLLGFWYWAIPLANLLLLIAPQAYRRLAERWRVTDGLFRESPSLIRRIRLELLLVTSAPVLMILLGVPPLRLLCAWALGSLLWSTTQYLEHAYAPRHVIDGAFNLGAPAVVSWLNLHRELDRNHHRHPHESWLHLPRLSPRDEPRLSYWRHYLRQWRGPQPTSEAAPAPLAREDLA